MAVAMEIKERGGSHLALEAGQVQEPTHNRGHAADAGEAVLASAKCRQLLNFNLQLVALNWKQTR